MTSLDNTKSSDCSTAGKGFAKTSNQPESAVELNCSTAGKGFARTENNEIVSEDCPLPHGPGKGFAKTDPRR